MVGGSLEVIMDLGTVAVGQIGHGFDFNDNLAVTTQPLPAEVGRFNSKW